MRQHSRDIKQFITRKIYWLKTQLTTAYNQWCKTIWTIGPSSYKYLSLYRVDSVVDRGKLLIKKYSLRKNIYQLYFYLYVNRLVISRLIVKREKEGSGSSAAAVEAAEGFLCLSLSYSSIARGIFFFFISLLPRLQRIQRGEGGVRTPIL